jgi:hypothetical protein
MKTDWNSQNKKLCFLAAGGGRPRHVKKNFF